MKNLLLGAICILSTMVFAQSSSISKFKKGFDLNHCNTETYDDFKFIGGTMFHKKTGKTIAYLSKLDAGGIAIWEKMFRINEQDSRLLDFVINDDGDIYVTGYTDSNDPKLMVVKFDQNGLKLDETTMESDHPFSFGTNIIFNEENKEVIISGLYTDKATYNFNKSVTSTAFLVSMDTNLDINWTQEFSGNGDAGWHNLNTINDIVLTPTGYFLIGQIGVDETINNCPWQGPGPIPPNYTGCSSTSGVLAIFVTTTGGFIKDLSFNETNSTHMGISGVYDAPNDELFLLSNPSVYHQPMVTRFSDFMSGNPIMSDNILLEMTNAPVNNPAGFQIIESPYNTNQLVAAGYFKDARNGTATTWIVEFNKSLTANHTYHLYDVPTGNFTNHGGGMFSTFPQFQYPIAFNQEIISVNLSGIPSINLLAPHLIPSINVFGIDIVKLDGINAGQVACLNQEDEESPLILTPISIHANNNSGFSSNIDQFFTSDPINFDEEILCGGQMRRSSFTEGVKEATFMESQVLVSPNPSSGLYNIDLQSTKYTNVRVLNAQGKQIGFQSLTNSDAELHQIDLSNQPVGLYFLSFEGNEERQTIRLIKQ